MTPKPSPPKTVVAKSETFKLVVRLGGDMFAGEIYPDGSALDGPAPDLMRCGRAFVVTNREGVVIAAAAGVLPPWIRDIG